MRRHPTRRSNASTRTRSALSATATIGALAALGLSGCGTPPPARAEPACPIPLPTTRPDAEWPLAPSSTASGCADGGAPEPGRYVSDLP